MTTLRLKYALMAGAAMAMMVLPMGTMMTATAQEDELAEDVEASEPADEMSDEALDSDADTDPSEDTTGPDDDVEAGTDDAAVPEDPAPATDDAGAVPLGEDDGGSRAKTGPPT